MAFQPPTGMTPTSSPMRLWRIVVVIDPLEVAPTRFGPSSQLASAELTTVFERMVPDSVTGKREPDETFSCASCSTCDCSISTGIAGGGTTSAGWYAAPMPPARTAASSRRRSPSADRNSAISWLSASTSPRVTTAEPSRPGAAPRSGAAPAASWRASTSVGQAAERIRTSAARPAAGRSGAAEWWRAIREL